MSRTLPSLYQVRRINWRMEPQQKYDESSGGWRRLVQLYHVPQLLLFFMQWKNHPFITISSCYRVVSIWSIRCYHEREKRATNKNRIKSISPIGLLLRRSYDSASNCYLSSHSPTALFPPIHAWGMQMGVLMDEGIEDGRMCPTWRRIGELDSLLSSGLR